MLCYTLHINDQCTKENIRPQPFAVFIINSNLVLDCFPHIVVAFFFSSAEIRNKQFINLLNDIVVCHFSHVNNKLKLLGLDTIIIEIFSVRVLTCNGRTEQSLQVALIPNRLQ